MARLRVKAERSHLNLQDDQLIDITNFNTEFNIPIQKQIDNGPWETVETLTFTPEQEAPTPTPTPEPTPGNVLYDSNIDGKWNNGQKRTVTDKEGNVDANGKGLYTAASGDPQLEIQGNGEAILVCKPGHGRIYICANNYNSILEKEFKILDGNVDNVSDKLRSRHGEGGAESNRFGGVGGSYSIDECGIKIENFHNVHSDSKSAKLAKKLEIGKWYKDRLEVKDSADRKAIEARRWIDYGDGKRFVKVLDHKMTEIEGYYMDKALYDKKSYFWLRMNNESGVGKIAFRNVKLVALP